MDLFLSYYLVLTSLGTLAFIWYWLHRILHPLECSCGKRIVFLKAFSAHIKQVHRWVEH